MRLHVLVVAAIGLSTIACQKDSRSGPDTPVVEAAPEKAPPPAQRSSDEVTIETTPVAGDVYMLTGRGGNIGVLASDSGVVMVDDQFAELAPKIRAAIEALGKGGPTFVINTHWHGDHTGGNPSFGEAATIVAHDNVRKRLATAQTVRGRTTEPMAATGLPVVTFAESVSLHRGGEHIRVVHLPTGHTDGDSAVFFTNADVVHMGDHFFAGRFPFIDLESGGSVVGYTSNVARVLAEVTESTKIIPGHGPLSTAADLRAFHDMLVETTAIVNRAKAAGKPLAAIKKAGLPARYASWGSGFISTDKWIETIYASL